MVIDKNTSVKIRKKKEDISIGQQGLSKSLIKEEGETESHK